MTSAGIRAHVARTYLATKKQVAVTADRNKAISIREVQERVAAIDARDEQKALEGNE